MAENVRAPGPSRTPWPPTARKSTTAPGPKKHAQKKHRFEFNMHVQKSCSMRRAPVACLPSTRRGHPSHAMLGKASARATHTVRRRPPRQREAGARAPGRPSVTSRQFQQIHAGIAARQRGRRRTVARQGPAPRSENRLPKRASTRSKKPGQKLPQKRLTVPRTRFEAERPAKPSHPNRLPPKLPRRAARGMRCCGSGMRDDEHTAKLPAPH